jgi:hypothetical protein
VANVNDDKQAVLRYELETFVCEGQYEKALQHIVETYLSNLGQEQQPGVWISGFFGSGKSHFVKMLRALWMDIPFADGTTARTVAHLPVSVQDQLKELSTQGKRNGRLHAATGTLSSSANGSVRLALLNVVFKSVDLPTDYAKARFVMWLKSIGVFASVQQYVEDHGCRWDEELDNFYVSDVLANALMSAKPNMFDDVAACLETIRMQYPTVADISNDDMITTLKQALTENGKFPLTLIALDEVQQYILDDPQRSLGVQDAVEVCCKSIGSQLMFVGTGQSALVGTDNLKRLEGRFTVRFDLSDADVDTVVRRVVLAKKPSAIPVIQKVMETNIGEISRHLAGTALGHKTEDEADFVSDYPILPTTRRFWEKTLRALDRTGTDSQLRNQLSMVLNAARINLDKPVGTIVPADHLYFESASRLLQSQALPREFYRTTMTWKESNDQDEQLKARACGLVFLINSLTAANKEAGIHANVETLADLMVEDLTTGGAALHSRLPALLDDCPLLMHINKDEYHIQTSEGVVWQGEFAKQLNALGNSVTQVDGLRNERIEASVRSAVGNIQLSQGRSNVTRKIDLVFGPVLPPDACKRVCVWVRHGWGIAESSLKAEAAQAGMDAPTIFVFVPKKSADDLYRYLKEYKAATLTLEKKAVPTTPEGMQARASIESTRDYADQRINELLSSAVADARVYQGGGQEVSGADLAQTIRTAAANSLKRLYPKFGIADNPGWAKVYEKAKDGAPDALTAIGFPNGPEVEPVCKVILAAVGAGMKGAEIRTTFEEAPYGWSQDTVDGALQVLLVGGLMIVQDEYGAVIPPKQLERKAIGKSIFKVETQTVSIAQRIDIRNLYLKLSVNAKPGEELGSSAAFLYRLKELAATAGGGAPLPMSPDTSLVDKIMKCDGNTRLTMLHANRGDLEASIALWKKTAAAIKQRLPQWEHLQRLLPYAKDQRSLQEYVEQASAINENRLLLSDPDPLPPLVSALEKGLRSSLQKAQDEYQSAYAKGAAELEGDGAWKQMTPEERSAALEQCQVYKLEHQEIGTSEQLLSALEKCSLQSWNDRTAALSSRFGHVRELAARAHAPQAQTVDLPKGTLLTDADVDQWLQETAKLLKKNIGKGPIVLR